jgi:hypothetical protein
MAYANARRPGGRIFQWPPNRRVYCPSVLPPKIGDAGAGGGAAGGGGAIGANFGASLVTRFFAAAFLVGLAFFIPFFGRAGVTRFTLLDFFPFAFVFRFFAMLSPPDRFN